MYYNTTNQRQEVLKKSRKKVETQEDRILRIFRLIPGRSMGPNIVTKMYNNYYPSIPPTSTRRAITDLTAQGKLIKTDVMEIGGYGKQEHTWKINEDS